jgi:uncharacterized protein
MISLKQLLGKDDKFFVLLEASAQQGRASVQALKRLLDDEGRTCSLEEFVRSRRAEKDLAREISEHVLKTFVAALEREDIEALSLKLYKIPKTVEKFAQRYLICAKHVQGVDFQRQVVVLENSTDQVVEMVKHLRKGTHLEKIKEENDKLQRLEGEADKLMLDLLRDLYHGQQDAYKVIALKELYELLEKVIDRCRDAGNVVTQIILKHA